MDKKTSLVNKTGNNGLMIDKKYLIFFQLLRKILKIIFFVVIFIFAVIIFFFFKIFDKENMQINKSQVNEFRLNTTDYFDIDENTHTKSLSENVLMILGEYPDLMDVIKRGDLKLPTFGTMIPQGITKIEGYIIITAYDERNVDNSKCYVINSIGETINIATLDTKSHVGSIAYDKINNLLWIPDIEGMLNAYELDSVLNDENVQAKYQFDHVSSGITSQNTFSDIIDYLCVEDNYIYIGNFSINSDGLVKKYKIISYDENIILSYVTEFYVPSKIQGISFYNYNNQKYMLLSQSFGRNNNSHLLMFKYDEKIVNYVNYDDLNIELPPMLEQITVDGKYLYVIFESNAEKYKNGKTKIDCICVLDIEKIFDKSV